MTPGIIREAITPDIRTIITEPRIPTITDRLTTRRWCAPASDTMTLTGRATTAVTFTVTGINLRRRVG